MCFSFDEKRHFSIFKRTICLSKRHIARDTKRAHVHALSTPSTDRKTEQRAMKRYASQSTTLCTRALPSSLTHSIQKLSSPECQQQYNTVATLILSHGPKSDQQNVWTLLDISSQLQPISGLSRPWIASRARRGGIAAGAIDCERCC